MFGYVKIYEDELKIKDYKIYKSYYCGLCKTLGKRYSFASRFTLSYDFTFMALVLDSLNNEKNHMVRENCIKHIGTRQGRGYVQYSDAIDYTADVSILLTYYKIKDDFYDTKSIKRLKYLPLILMYHGAYKKAKRKYPQVAQSINDTIGELSILERSGCDDADKTAYCFSKILKCIFAEYNSNFEEFAVALGRFIYCIDAYDDLKRDLKTGEYNPYIHMYRLTGENDEKIPLAREAIADSIYMTLAMLGKYTEKLDFKKNKDIINNIIYLGMRKTTDNLRGMDN